MVQQPQLGRAGRELEEAEGGAETASGESLPLMASRLHLDVEAARASALSNSASAYCLRPVRS